MDSNTDYSLDNGQWIAATGAEPCEACGKSDWCSRNRDSLVCRRVSQHPTRGSGVEKQDDSGQTYWSWAATSQLHSHPEPQYTDYGERADVDTLDRVYSALLAELTLSPLHREDLIERGMTGPQAEECFRTHGIRSLPQSGRASIVRKLAAAGHERDLLTVPGFVIRTGNRGGAYYTLSGVSGLLIPCRDVGGRIVGFQVRGAQLKGGKYKWLTSRTKFDADGPGPGSPIHVPLFEGETTTIRITEGILKATLATIAGGLLTIGLPGLSAAGLADVVKQIAPGRVLVAFDADWRTNPNVRRATRRLLLQLRELEVDVSFEVWDEHKGIDDLLLAGGTSQIIEFADAVELLKDPPRVQVYLGADEHRVTDEVCEALTTDEMIYQRDGRLVTVCDGRIVQATEAWLRDRISRKVAFLDGSDDDEPSEQHPTKWCVQSVMSRVERLGFRNLSGVVNSPVLRADGSIVTEPGYDELTGLFLESPGRIPTLDNPTHDDAVAAVDRLLEVYRDFPFDEVGHQSALVAFMLTPLARHLFDGPAPLFLVDSNVPGSGKSLICDLNALITLGTQMSRMSNTGNDEECRKRITALVRGGDRVCLIDNISGSLGCASLDAALTATVWKDRLMGQSEMVEMPLSITWCATGNNVMLRADTSRRVLHIRLESPEEHPEQRTGFQHSDIRRYVKENRSQLLGDALCILAAYIQAGRPNQQIPPWGSFEAWSDLVRSAVVWVGMPDPCDGRRELVESSDVDAIAYRQLLQGWDELDDETARLTIRELLSMLAGAPDRYQSVREAVVELAPPKVGELPTSRQLGNTFRKFKGRVCGGKTLRQQMERSRRTLWYVE